ncbi:hypothetical protein H6F46_05150 [Limnothrix sp. FACHB-1083]|uniref:hypothetical protein n=1 Tax=unclassified Limnothrix TaxID=2632864 RepID=UPI001680A84E|nr:MULTISPECIES: hypothetical protein [unclassified Limnothrix]MBD2160078.1 hypothetical protein [Limnothrix sp. FACHB-1083]MBD2190780.1 hypothetical protein [Limnothrix sp. FACHB-1088]
MNSSEFEIILKSVTQALNQEIQVHGKFQKSEQFEEKVRDLLEREGLDIDRNSKSQAFPDIAIEQFGVEVKFTEKDNWRSIANSISEGQRVPGIEKIYLIYGKMGGVPEVRWDSYGDCIIHVRTSHHLRFEVSMEADRRNLFNELGITYEVFRNLPDQEKMVYMRQYAKKRQKPGEYIWWLE